MGLNSLANSFKELGWGEGGKEAFYTLQNSQKSEVKKKSEKGGNKYYSQNQVSKEKSKPCNVLM